MHGDAELAVERQRSRVCRARIRLGGEGSVQVQPRYLQFYLGAGLSFNLLKHLPDD